MQFAGLSSLGPGSGVHVVAPQLALSPPSAHAWIMRSLISTQLDGRRSFHESRQPLVGNFGWAPSPAFGWPARTLPAFAVKKARSRPTVTSNSSREKGDTDASDA